MQKASVGWLPSRLGETAQEMMGGGGGGGMTQI
jgi:hypothetical protein